MTTSLADRMKFYEDISCAQQLIPNLPVCIRVDAKAFHSWCRGLERPFDARLQRVMDDVTAKLVDMADAVIGYTQSDEISLVLWNYAVPNSDIYFHGRRDKLVSVIASAATWHFQRALVTVPAGYIPENVGKPALFDCRAWNVPSPQEACNYLLWREQDATRNSVSMAAQTHYSTKQLHGKNGKEMQEMLFQKGVNWNDYPPRFKRGAYWKRLLVAWPFTAEELEALPPKHDARTNPGLLVQRHLMSHLPLPPLGSIANAVEAIFYGATPLAKSHDDVVSLDNSPTPL